MSHPRRAPGRRRPAPFLCALLVAALCAALSAVVLAVSVPAPASAQVLGPGRPTIPGFSGYVLADGGELGIGRLPDGRFGVCTDTGGEFPWPADPSRSTVTNPRTAYALATYLQPARTDGRLAAALWWAVGHDFGQNSRPDRVLSHVHQLRSESPAIFADVKALHDRVVADATAHAAPSGGYDLAIDVTEGSVERVGVRSGAGWLEGREISLQITGPGEFDPTGSRSWSGTTRDQARTLAWTRTGPGKVVVRATVSGLPSRHYERWWGGGATQRVLAAADLVTISDTDAVGTVDELVPLRVVKTAEGADAAGLLGVGVEVRSGSPTGPVTDTHTFTAADLAPDGSVAVTFAASPARCESGCRYHPDRTYYVVVTAEPPGWSPAATVVAARLDEQATALVARLDDRRVWAPSLVTQISDQRATVGDVLHDVVTVRDTGGHAITAHWALLGPLPPVASGGTLTCEGVDWTRAALAASGDFLVAGDGDYTVGRHTVTSPGCYTYVESADATPQTQPIATTAPGIPEETTLAAHQPALATQVSAQKAEVGSTLTDAVAVTGTHGATVSGHWRLLGPVAPATEGAAEPRSPGRCQGLDWTGAPVAGEGTFTATGDGTVTVGQTTVTATGCYTYVEDLAPTDSTHAVAWTEPGIVSETAIITRTPRLVTQVSDQMAHVGAVVHDRVTVTGTDGARSGTWRLIGPADPVEGPRGRTCAGVDWAGVPVAAEGVFTISGDGTVTVGEHRVQVAGCYTYVEDLSGTPTGEPLPLTRPGIPSETTLITHGPTVVTQISDQDVVVGTRIHDTVAVRGTGGATISARYALLGPLAPQRGDSVHACTELSWRDAPVASRGRFTVTGDGVVRVGEFTVRDEGCYTYVEWLDETPTTDAVETMAGILAETTIVRPAPAAAPAASDDTSAPGAVIDAGGGASGDGTPALLVLSVLTFGGAGAAAAIGVVRRGRRTHGSHRSATTG